MEQPDIKEEKDKVIPGFDDVNIGEYKMTGEQAERVTKNFNKLRMEIRRMGLLEASHPFFARKFLECASMMALAVFLQTREYYLASALLMGLCWQQLGWMIHEYAHHQHFKNHFLNDLMSYVVGNFMQGFSSGGWKEQHNVHHAATNVVGRDGDLDLMPLWATVASDLKLMDTSVYLWLLQYQHIYWTLGLPFLRLSWLLQSVQFVFFSMRDNFYTVHHDRAWMEQLGLGLHWFFVILQLYCLPSFSVRVMYFVVSQLFGGFLLAHVVTYNHYSTDKFLHNDKILENYPALQLYTTRNMRPGVFIDWLWGGLNYQIEHHLFPTMPRHNLKKVMPLVKEFCKENDLPYMVDDYFTGWSLGVQQFANVAMLARKISRKLM
uniref:FA_desaturase domain-containing protein n=1 Tax=Steinernema glaseri TaxID=37863 RepID=A0A1I8ALK2_9BILA